MKILAIETSGPTCAVAVGSWRIPPRTLAAALAAMRVVGRTGPESFTRHSDTLFGLLTAVLGRRGLVGITGIAVSLGPGSFTGLRIGLAAAKTFARFGRIPLVGVPTLAAMAAGVSGARWLVPSLDALRGEVYAAVYRPGPRGPWLTGGPWVITPQDLAARTPRGALPVTGQPRAALVAALGAVRLATGRPADPDRLVPLYLRRPAAAEKRRSAPRSRPA